MTPVDQQTDHDCMRACVASLLSLSLDEVPDFGYDEDQWDRFEAWLAQRGMYPVCLDAKAFADWRPGGYHMISGMAGGKHHAVVGYCGEMVHDPHPCRLGLDEALTYELIVVADLRLVKMSGSVA